MIFIHEQDRGARPARDEDRVDLTDLWDTLLEVGHTVEETCTFMTAYAAGRVS